MAEWTGCVELLTRLRALKISHVHLVGDAALVIKQLCRVHRCHKPHLQTFLTRAHLLANEFESIEFHHVYRDWNGAADYIAGEALKQLVTTTSISDSVTLQLIHDLNRLPELFSQTHLSLTARLTNGQPLLTPSSAPDQGGDDSSSPLSVPDSSSCMLFNQTNLPAIIPTPISPFSIISTYGSVIGLAAHAYMNTWKRSN